MFRVRHVCLVVGIRVGQKSVLNTRAREIFMIFNTAQSPALEAALAALNPTAHLSSQLSTHPSKVLDAPQKQSLDIYDVAITTIPWVVIKFCRT